jgi:hypothetical protein
VLLLVAWLHAVVVTRLQYVPDGWSKRYEFNETDLYNAARVACSWIDRSFIGGVIREHLPMDALDWNAIAFLIGETVRKRMFHLRFKSPALRITCGVSLDTDSSRIRRFMVAELTTKTTSQF